MPARPYQKRQTAPAVVVESPRNERELVRLLANPERSAAPIRPRGGGSATTAVTRTLTGTIIDTGRMAEIRHIDLHDYTVTAQPGVRIRDLASALAEQGLELEGSHDLMDRTLGGAVSSACIGPCMGDDGALFASQLTGARLVTTTGNVIAVGAERQSLLAALRMSYGMLGVFSELTLKVRPVQPFSVSHRRISIDAFAKTAERLATTRTGVKFYLMPFRDRVYLDLRRYDGAQSAGGSLAWRLKDWGESTVMPQVFRSLRKVVPVAGMRYRLIDELSSLTQGLVNNRLVESGSSSTVQATASNGRQLNYSTWIFPAADFGLVVTAYRHFCQQVQSRSGFRCDMPAVGFRLPRDATALLSPCFDEPMVALRAVSTESGGWDDFVIDFGEFARHWGGIPLFNQSQSIPAGYVSEAYGERLAFFRKIRQRLDPDGRLLNPYLTQHFR